MLYLVAEKALIDDAYNEEAYYSEHCYSVIYICAEKYLANNKAQDLNRNYLFEYFNNNRDISYRLRNKIFDFDWKNFSIQNNIKNEDGDYINCQNEFYDYLTNSEDTDKVNDLLDKIIEELEFCIIFVLEKDLISILD